MQNYPEEVTFLNAGHVGGLMNVEPSSSLQKQRGWSNYKAITFQSKVQCFPIYSVLLALGKERLRVPKTSFNQIR